MIAVLIFLGFRPDNGGIVNISDHDSIKKALAVREKDSLLQIFVDTTYADQKSDIRSYFERLHKWSGFNGNVLFAVKGKVVYQGVFGFKDIKKKQPLKIDDAFQLASVTKTITSTAVLQLYEKGLIELEDNFRKYIPEFPEKYDGITIDYLLTHKSGLFEYYYFNDEEWRKRNDYLRFKELVSTIKTRQPGVNYFPGKRYNYNNLNYVLLAEIVERVSKRSFKKYLDDEIFRPAGMSNAFLFSANDSNAIQKKKVFGHYYGTRRYELEYADGVYGDKGIYASVGDMLAFDQALYSHTLLKKETLELATSAKHKKLRVDDNYGYGWRIDQSKGVDKVVYHAGWWKGFRTHFIRIGNNEATIVILSNRLKASKLSRKRMIKLLFAEN